MVLPISQLQNMEMQLYGGFGTNVNAPSYLNNYCTGYNFSMPAFNGYNYANSSSFGQTIPSNYAVSTQQPAQVLQQTAQNSVFQGLTKAEREAIVDYYAKNLEPSQSLMNAATLGALGTVIMTNPRIIAHPINYFTTTFGKESVVKNMFKGVKESGNPLNELWKNNSMIMEEAYSQMHRAEARSKWKIGAFRKRYSKEEFNQLKDIMEKAIKTGDVKEVAKATETLRHAYTNNGWLASPIANIRGKAKNVDKQLFDMANKASENGKAIRNNTSTLLRYRNSNMTFNNAFKKAGGKMALAFGAVEILMNFEKILTAFKEDKKTGFKQLGQSTVKAVANTAGWALGETAAIWAGAKLGATIGTAFGPGVGTAVGAVIGFIGGSIGMCLAGKATRKLVGDDVANKIQANELAKTSEGQLEMIQDVAGAMQKDKKVDPQAQQAVNKLLTLYA